jgi:NAD(P)H dehydrogenase (quinone)
VRIAVTTPTGNVGSRVARLLVQAGVRPVLLLRDPGRLDPELRELVDVEVGDLGDADYVVAATRGADALYWVDPTDLAAPDPNAETTRLGGIAAAAVTANGIGHTVFQSSVGAELRDGAGLLDGLGAVEQVLDATGLPVLHLRCGYFFTNLLMDLDTLRSGTVTTSYEPEVALPWVDPRDVGDVAAARLLAADWTGRQVQAVHGPADLTWTEVAGVLSAATGRSFRVEAVADEDVRTGLLAAGLAPAAADQVVGMAAGLRGFTPEQERSVLTTTPTTLAAWAAEHLRPALAD